MNVWVHMFSCDAITAAYEHITSRCERAFLHLQMTAAAVESISQLLTIPDEGIGPYTASRVPMGLLVRLSERVPTECAKLLAKIPVHLEPGHGGLRLPFQVPSDTCVVLSEDHLSRGQPRAWLEHANCFTDEQHADAIRDSTLAGRTSTWIKSLFLFRFEVSLS